MQKITTAKDLSDFRKNLIHEATNSEIREKILVCTGGGCIASGSLKIKDAFNQKLKEKNLDKTVKVIGTGCLGPCSKGPVVILASSRTFYQELTVNDVDEIIESHIIGGKAVERLTYRKETGSVPVPLEKDIDFFKKQTKIVLRNCGSIDPYSINDYISAGGYEALSKAINQMKPENVIEEMQKSGLRGRGGAGFPTYLKWKLAAKNDSDQKYILCNADEGDPGAYMDRSILEGDPHSVIEGMAIGAYAIGATKGYIYVRAEYPLAVERLNNAISQATQMGLLGKNIMGSGFNFELDIRMGSGAFVCGEETALIASIEGKRGEPRPRPPFPAQSGLWGKPTVLNNVETFANVTAIVINGGEWFASFGTDKSKGTKIFALAGAIANSGLFEVPIGTTLGDLLYDIGGGTSSGKPFKAAQIGGPSGGCIPKHHLNVSLDYESLNELGAIMGSGGLIVMDEDSCMVDVARFFLEFVQEESCGKCTPCRVGTKRMLEIVENICAGKGKPEDIDKLIELGEKIKKTALCGLGQSAPNPVLSTLRYFRHEYEAHIFQKTCPAGVCPGLVRAPCQSACPAHVDVPGFVSLVGEKRYAEALRLHRERNPFAAICARVCFHTCEDKCRRSTIDDPVSIRAVKRFMVDQEITVQLPEIRENSHNAQRKIAIIGAGPAGLSCAYFLARLGYKPKVFEAEQRPGGMLVQTIPAYRLPREVLFREIRMIENMGVDIETGKKLGKDFTLSDLKEMGFEAVFLGVGTPSGMIPNIPGIEADGIADALKFLQTYNLRGSVPVGKRIIVVGGGNAAIDAARTALRLGSEEVHIVYRRTQDEMPAWAEEIEAAIEEGIQLHTLTNPVEILQTNGKVSGVKCIEMKLGEFDKSGRRRPEASDKSFVIESDQVILATGQTLDCSTLFNGIQLETISNSKIKADPYTGQTSVPWIFTGGDAATGPSSVIEAVAGGEKAAVGIDHFLTGEDHAFWRKEIKVDTFFDPDDEPAPFPRKNLSLLAAERRRFNFDEVEQVYTEGEAIRQAKRCLRCDYGKC
ncbi:MAG: NADH-quinone oxidoreductase subunit NuoF [Bacteroidales bacterium]|nr:NADH-quinone oxidoreductase subunit NuoF [Bacteroidales bacterium]